MRAQGLLCAGDLGASRLAARPGHQGRRGGLLASARPMRQGRRRRPDKAGVPRASMAAGSSCRPDSTCTPRPDLEVLLLTRPAARLRAPPPRIAPWPRSPPRTSTRRLCRSRLGDFSLRLRLICIVLPLRLLLLLDCLCCCYALAGPALCERRSSASRSSPAPTKPRSSCWRSSTSSRSPKLYRSRRPAQDHKDIVRPCRRWGVRGALLLMRRVRVHRALYCRGRVEKMMRGSRHAGLGLSRLVAARVRILEVSNIPIPL